MLTSQAGMVLEQMGRKEAAMEAYRAVAAAYQNSDDPQLASEARSLSERVKSLELGLDGKLRTLMAGEPNAVPPLLEAVETLLSEEQPSEYSLNMASQVGQMLEMFEQVEAAGTVYDLIEQRFQNHPDEELAAQAQKRAENGRKRAALVGQPLTVEGVLLDGTPFDWGVYEGKLVLVDFWATWCMPCLREFPTTEKYYRAYRDKGFEVVGVNLDEDMNSVRQFLDVQPLPWQNVFAADPEARGFQNPMAVKCGVDAIPFLVLVG
jgi:thiol-disulfide isomerase/thioredoxin